eukprot:CAMPEP_0119113658 /NCGR_PEP_ID=MMETSP1180-20130426/44760_1 /TAXON_ID=3052 ORGANISM="Chlamydomonas cf sp, Strain CCMP681" /NCGR_SAMPLE_ID=MMETSP1180 /ASSEMBLY_ACC=CAM_ASM_000741 /LENGTH=41 /DNA_ID= /DNA_START= /DNA_END= /DNA_ORIENTATION=
MASHTSTSFSWWQRMMWPFFTLQLPSSDPAPMSVRLWPHLV